jgi:hypothetical protein
MRAAQSRPRLSPFISSLGSLRKFYPSDYDFKPLGVAIIGGLIVSQMLTLYTTPIIYLYLDRLRRRTEAKVEQGAPQPA